MVGQQPSTTTATDPIITRTVEDATAHSADHWLSSARRLVPTALDRARQANCFHGRWQTIIAKLERVPMCLSDLSSHPFFYKNALCLEQLQSVCRTLSETVELAGHCAEEDCPRRLGKLQVQSDLDAAIGKLDLNLRDCALLLKTGVLTEAAAPDRSSAEDSDANNGAGVRELLARLQIGHVEAKHRALDGLLRLIKEDEKHVVAAMLGRSNVAAVVQLLSAISPRIREKAATVVCLLAESGGFEKALVSEGALPPLLRLAESGSVVGREKAVISIQSLSASADTTAEPIAVKGGIRALVEICKTGDSICQSAAAGALRNLCAVPEIRQRLAEEGAVRAMIDLLNGAIVLESKEYAAEFIRDLTSSNNSLRHAAVKEGAIRSLLSCVDCPLHHEAAVGALRNVVTVLSYGELVDLEVFPRLIHVLRCGSLGAQQAAASAICRVSGSVDAKRSVGELGCLPLLVRMLEAKANGAREVAAQALASLLSYRLNARELKKDEKSVPNLVRLLDPGTGNAAKKYAVACLAALSSSRRCRKLMVAHGAIGYLRKLSDMEVQGARKLLERLDRGRKLRGLFSRK